MNHIYGIPGEEPGDQAVFDALRYLPQDYIVYAQPKLVHRRKVRYPDYVIVQKDLGVVVIEVKDWVKIEDRDAKQALIYRTAKGCTEWDDSPVEQARKAALLLNNILCDDYYLRNYAGKLDFPYRYAGFLPNIPMTTITWLEQAWGEGYLFGRDDLKPDRLKVKLTNIPAPFSCQMSDRQVDVVRAILDERNKIIDRKSKKFKGIYNPEQERVAKEPVKQPIGNDDDEKESTHQISFDEIVNPSIETRAIQLESSMPEEAADLKKALHVRLVRGFAGTGKTDILILRALYLHEQNPEMDILVTSFNKPLIEDRLRPELKRYKNEIDVITFDGLCANLFKKQHGLWSEPQNVEGVVGKLAEECPIVEQFGRKFLSEEITWMKESGLTRRELYINTIREGRARQSRSLSRKNKEKIFDFFERYQQVLAKLPAQDWQDLHERVSNYLQDGLEPEKRYDQILIDEAQHFAPVWINVVKSLLKPGGSLFICDDPSQSVYRFFSWRQKGVEVVGRTRWLRIPYRNTRQIFEAAYELISTNPLAEEMLQESGELIAPDLDCKELREGKLPQVRRFSNLVEEKEFVKKEILLLIKSGLLPSEISILHTRNYVLDSYRGFLPQEVQIDDLRRRTGSEYCAVFIPRIQDLFERDLGSSWQQEKAKEQLLFYMAMTRARDYLYMLYEQKWPKSLEPIRSKVSWFKNGSIRYQPE